MAEQLRLFDPPPPAPAPVRLTVAEKKRASGKGRYTLKSHQFEWCDERTEIRVFGTQERITVTPETARVIRLVGGKPDTVQVSRRRRAVVGTTYRVHQITDAQMAQIWAWHVEIVRAEAAREKR